MPQTSTRLRDAALAAASNGLYVFPCVPRGKAPAIPKWEQAATRDPDQIVKWWTRKPWNLGAAVGRSGLVVIDLDQSKGQQPPPEFPGAGGGVDVLVMLAQRAGQPAPWNTYTVLTPGGLHLYYRVPVGSDFRNTAGETGLGWRVDTRASGGYVVAAGSVRADGRYRVANNLPIADLPHWLAEALIKRIPRPRTEATEVTIHLPTDRAGAYLRAIVENETHTVTTTAAGGRNHALNRAAFNLGRLVGGGELEEHAAWQALTDAASVHLGIEGFTETEANTTIASGLHAGRLRPRVIRAT